ncbi:transcriptional regulator, AraC family [Sphaerochaeta globosa str. Buddy]|uniref:Transcriptional regulator, AraC family n=2 Tax=Sphaerochaeta TaxID=399320 RepID=F0RTF1_SPHGB|nr:transcriptional regulator, AraC family [Sphaerochaeta globosa str. Buddy]
MYTFCMRAKAQSTPIPIKRIAFLARNPFGGASVEMISHLCRALGASASLVMVGYVKENSAYEQVLQLLTPANFDALIVWGTVEAFAPVYAKAKEEELAVISIGGKHPDHPCLLFDSYSGMKAVVLHCIYEHKAKRLAFIRGPQEDAYAQERYQAYLDALSYAGIPFQSDLISPPVDWSCGQLGLEALYRRGLAPGSDYEAIICASDLLLTGVYSLLGKQGINIGEDVKVIGFNDSKESRSFNPPCTTVRLPYREMSCAVYTLLDRVWKGQSVSDLSYPAKTIIRRSCGCTVQDTFGQTSRSLEAVQNRMAGLFHLAKEEKERLIEVWNLLSFYEQEQTKENKARLERLFLQCVQDIIGSSEDIELLHAGLLRCAELSNQNLRPLVSELLFPLISRAQEQQYVHTLARISKREEMLSSFKVALGEIHSYNQLQTLLIKYQSGFRLQGSSFLATKGETMSFAQEPGIHSLKPIIRDQKLLGYLHLQPSQWEASLLETLCVYIGDAAYHIQRLNKPHASSQQPSTDKVQTADIYLYGAPPQELSNRTKQTFTNFEQLVAAVLEAKPLAILTDSLSAVEIMDLRSLTNTKTVPIVIHKRRWSNQEGETYHNLSQVLLCDPALAGSKGFLDRLEGLVSETQPLKDTASAMAKQIFFALHRRFDTPFARWELAQELGLSEDYLTVLFKAEYGLTVWEYLNRYRIWHASNLLGTTTLPVELVAKMSGFSSSPYFCRMYRNLTGKAPSAFRSGRN